ncbi:MAG: zinc metallopeptidase [Oscillospiraceae bacterium]|nr:zinc metallopeptidase [Oscillospiraceae bacterium]
MDFIYLLFSDYWPLAIGIIGALIFSIVTTLDVDATFKKYNADYVDSKIPACDAARQILDMNGLYDVQVVKIKGHLTDNYNPKTKTVSLSETVYGSATVSAVGVAAHECGHAIQHAVGYTPIKLRTMFAPVVSLFSNTWIWVFIIGCYMQWMQLIGAGIVFFSTIVIFQLITLPVEFNASRRAIDTLVKTKILYGTEVAGARKVLKAAAMTYVSALITSIMQLLKLMTRMNRRR